MYISIPNSLHLQYSSSLQAFLMVILFSLFYITFGPKIASATTFDVTLYNAIGDGITDDTAAFVQAWGDLCADISENPTLIIPSDKTFLIHCVAFAGPCKSSSSSILIKLLGDITAPKSLVGWESCDTQGHLMYFRSVQGLTIAGPGQIDGQGSIWWGDGDVKLMLLFKNCDGLRLRGSRFVNSPKTHISISGCKGADIQSPHISAPDYSPNTNGIDISWSSHINIHDSSIGSGGLGKHSSYTAVEKVLVRQSYFTSTQNGARIKTVPYGKGYARSIVFEHILLSNVKNPIIIDQHYCTNMSNADCHAPVSLVTQ
ncbi:putative endo-polygalacturonase [Helianthus annuus]|nr:putative endo-polygalacturonase [Helianthus annuus]KAJ0858202.1 putative endo-polygalacturonase [Helianthus annuus]